MQVCPAGSVALKLSLGFEFAAVEMRWGIRELQSEAHETYQICMDEIARCLNESRGVAFVSILGDKYGYRPFPASIPIDEFKLLYGAVAPEIQKLLDDWFELDTSVPAYCLRAITADLKPQWLNDDGQQLLNFKRNFLRHNWSIFDASAGLAGSSSKCSST